MGNMAEISNFLGWTGTIFVLLAYLLLTANVLKSNKFLYQLLNILGAAGLAFNAMYHADLPNMVVNLIWTMIGLVAIIIFAIRKRRSSN